MTPPSTSIDIRHRDRAHLAVILAAWGERLANAVQTRFGARFTPTMRSRLSEDGSGDPLSRLAAVIEIHEGSLPRFLVEVTWSGHAPGSLRTSARAYPTQVDVVARWAKRVGNTLMALALLGGLVHLGLNWTEIWAHYERLRVLPGRRSVLIHPLGQILLLGVLSLVVALVMFACAGKIDWWLTRRRLRASEELLDRDFAPSLAECVREISAAADKDPALAAMLGLAAAPEPHVAGTPHPTLRHLVWDGQGRLSPAKGFTWANEDPKSNAVRFTLAGQAVPGHEHLVYDEDGTMRPIRGYTWATGDPNSLEVRPTP